MAVDATGVARRGRAPSKREIKQYLSFEIANIPTLLCTKKQWVCWRCEQRGEKLAKIPISPLTGRVTAVNDPSKITDFHTAVDFARKNGMGIGFCTFRGDGIVMVDVDDKELALKLARMAGSYAEWSPSRQGAHIYVLGRWESSKHRRGKIEVYDSDRFFTVTSPLFLLASLKAFKNSVTAIFVCF